LLTLAKTADGGQQMTVRLHPAELGMVQVRIAQAASGVTKVDITADNPATLLALQRDQPQLHRALDDAGIAAAGRTVTFHVAQPAQAANANAPVAANGHGTSQQGSAGRANAGTTNADGSAGGGRGNHAARERTAYPTSRRAGTPAPAIGTTGGAARTSYRIGLDITA
jgi:flagellar hook-length control protein FliK